MSGDVQVTRRSWRDVIKIHPAADLFPLMSEAELRELGEDIRAHGLQHPIVLYRESGVDRDAGSYLLLDGRNRLDAMELVEVPFTLAFERKPHTQRWRWRLIEPDDQSIVSDALHDSGVIREETIADPFDFVLSANAHRRHLTGEKKRVLIAAVLKARPESSDRQIATVTKVDHKTVGSIRTDMEGRGEIPHVEVRTDTRGRQQPTKKVPTKAQYEIEELPGGNKRCSSSDEIATLIRADAEDIEAERPSTFAEEHQAARHERARRIAALLVKRDIDAAVYLQHIIEDCDKEALLEVATAIDQENDRRCAS